MAAQQKGSHLTNRQIMMVAGAMMTENIKLVAREFMGFTEEFIETIAMENKDDDEAFKRSVIRRWANMNSDLQVKVRV